MAENDADEPSVMAAGEVDYQYSLQHAAGLCVELVYPVVAVPAGRGGCDGAEEGTVGAARMYSRALRTALDCTGAMCDLDCIDVPAGGRPEKTRRTRRRRKAQRRRGARRRWRWGHG
jgi:hypothetical protein